MAMVEKRIFVVTTLDKDDKEVSRFLRDIDKSGFTDWLHQHLTWAYSNGYGVEFDAATEEDIAELGNRRS